VNCKEVINLMDGYLDSELDPVTSQTVEQHLRDCPNCDRIYKAHGSLMRAIASASPYHKAPAGLRERIQSSLREEIAEQPIRDVSSEMPLRPLSKQSEPRTVFFGTQWNWLALAAAIIVAAIITFNLVPRLRPGGDQLLATQLIASHVRSLMASHLTDVASTDQHTVKPWFNGKLPFSPPVPDPAAQGFPLIGGRLDYVENHPVAALVYQHRKHFINLFIWPSTRTSSTAKEPRTQQGYNTIHWNQGGMEYWSVSDMNQGDLGDFVQLVRGGSSPSSSR